MTISIIAAGPWDVQLLRTIRLQALQEVPSAYGSTYEREVGYTAADWQERLATACTFLAVPDPTVDRDGIPEPDPGAPVGSVTALWLRNGDMALTGMYVAPPARGSGVAQALIGAVVDLTRSRGGLRVVLDVTEGNDRAIRCYTRSGFALTGRRRPSRRDPGVAELEYARPLADGTADVGSRG